MCVCVCVCVCVCSGGCVLGSGPAKQLFHLVFHLSPTSPPSCDWVPGISWGANSNSRPFLMQQFLAQLQEFCKRIGVCVCCMCAHLSLCVYVGSMYDCLSLYVCMCARAVCAHLSGICVHVCACVLACSCV